MDTKGQSRGSRAGSAVRQRDPEAARRRLLDAGAGAFAEAGYAGARVDVIADRAGLNKRMLYHYFGDKAGLYRAVLDDRLRALRQPDSGADGPWDLAAFVARLDGTLARLLLWDLLQPVAHGSPTAETERCSEMLGVVELAGALGAAPGARSPIGLAPMLMAFLMVSRARGEGRTEGGEASTSEGDVLMAQIQPLVDALIQAHASPPAKPRIWIRLKLCAMSKVRSQGMG